MRAHTSPLTVLAWPAHDALRAMQHTDRVFVISIETVPTNDRTAARHAIRTAICEALDVVTGCDASQRDVASVPGQPVHLAGSPIGLSISHEVGMSVAAIHLHGAVGIDIVRRDAISEVAADWPILARDYLGPAAAARIGASDLTQRLAVFADEWTAQEARLKCRGFGLIEWDAARESIAAFNLHPLTLPQPWIGTLAIEKKITPHRPNPTR